MKEVEKKMINNILYYIKHLLYNQQLETSCNEIGFKQYYNVIILGLKLKEVIKSKIK